MTKIEIEAESLSIGLAIILLMCYGTLSYLIGAGTYQFEGYGKILPPLVWLGMTYPCGIGLYRTFEIMFKEQQRREQDGDQDN